MPSACARMSHHVRRNVYILTLVVLVRVQDLRLRQEEVEYKKKEDMEHFLSSVGKEVVDQRLTDYMTSRTTGGKNMIDPSSRLEHLHPSKHTNFKTWAFGLGTAPVDPVVLEREKARHPSVITDPWLADPDWDPEDARAKLKPAFGGRPGTATAPSGTGDREATFPAFPGTEGTLPRPDAEESLRRERAERAAALAAERAKKKKTALVSPTKETAAEGEASEDGSESAGPSHVGPVSHLEVYDPLSGTVAASSQHLVRPSRYEGRAKDGVVVTLTPHETLKVAAAKARIQDRVAQGEPKEVCGKVYGGSKFLATPERIVFQDFELGEEMRHTVTLTNVSFAFNSFKVLPLPTHLTDFFEVVYTRPGRMSAGLTCSILIIFRPLVYQDIEAFLPCLAETGPFNIPLCAYTKKLVVSLRPAALLDFGVVVRGESRELTVAVTNKGGLNGEMALTLESITAVDSQKDRKMQGKHNAAAALALRDPKAVTAVVDSDDEVIPTDAAAEDAAELANMTAMVLGLRTGLDETGQSAADSSALLGETRDTLADTVREGSSSPSPARAARRARKVQQADPLNAESAQHANMVRDVAACQAMLTFPATHMVGAYGGTTFPVVFAPQFEGAFEVRLLVTFTPINPYDLRKEKEMQEAASNGGDAQVYRRHTYPTQTFHVLLVGVASPVPIFLNRTVIDYQSIVYDQLYRDIVYVNNRSVRTMNIECSVPAWCADNIVVSPDQAYVQGRDRQAVQYRFKATAAFWQACQRMNCIDPNESNVIVIEMRVTVPEQVIPVLLTLRAHVSRPDLELVLLQPPKPPLAPAAAGAPASQSDSRSGGEVVPFPSSHDEDAVMAVRFGSVFVNQAAAVPVHIKNHSALLQKLVFVTLPKDFVVQPLDGQLALLPGASVVRTLLFQPTAALDYSGTVVARSAMGQDYRIRISGTGVQCPLSFSQSQLVFSPCADQEDQTTSLYVTNPGSTPQWLEFSPPPAFTYVKIIPAVANVAPGATVRIQFEFLPRVFPLAAIPNGGYPQATLTDADLVDETLPPPMEAGGELTRAPSALSTASGMSQQSSAADALPATRLRALHGKFTPPPEDLLAVAQADAAQFPEQGQGVFSGAAGYGNVLALENLVPHAIRYTMPEAVHRAVPRRQREAVAAAAAAARAAASEGTEAMPEAVSEVAAAQGAEADEQVPDEAAPRLDYPAQRKAYFPYLEVARYVRLLH